MKLCNTSTVLVVFSLDPDYVNSARMTPKG